MAALKEFEGDVETLTHIFLVDEKERLHGVVPLVKVLLAPREMVLKSLATTIMWCRAISTRARRRWRSCSTSTTCARCRCWTADKKLAGVIYAEQVIAQLRTMN